MAKKSVYFYVWRSSMTGRMVSAKWAAKHPDVTVRERRRR